MTDREEAVARLRRARSLGERYVVRLRRPEVEETPGVPPDGADDDAGAPEMVGGSADDVAGGPGLEAADAAGAGSAAEESEIGMEPITPAFDEAAWAAVRDEALGCTKCDLCESRTQVVWGSGTPHTDLMVVGEAPGYHEDQQGEAFVGRAGQLLTRILAAIGFARDQVFITNVLKCRPPGNADPQPHQVASCEPYLQRQIELIDPAAILTLGRHAARTLLGTDEPMRAYRGRVFAYHDVPLVATYHPAALLRNAGLKRPTWEDVQLLKKVYDEQRALRAGEPLGDDEEWW